MVYKPEIHKIAKEEKKGRNGCDDTMHSRLCKDWHLSMGYDTLVA